MKNRIIEFFELRIFYFLESLCRLGLWHDYQYLRQKVKGWDSFGKEHNHMMDVRICTICNQRQALISYYWGEVYETINKEER